MKSSMYKCKHCNREFSSSRGCAVHESRCPVRKVPARAIIVDLLADGDWPRDLVPVDDESPAFMLDHGGWYMTHDIAVSVGKFFIHWNDGDLSDGAAVDELLDYARDCLEREQVNIGLALYRLRLLEREAEYRNKNQAKQTKEN